MFLRKRLEDDLHKRKIQGTLRTLKVSEGKIDFSSNDYLGVVNYQEELLENPIHLPLGATGSRLLNGNHSIHDEFESYLANFFNAPSALIMNSGYSASLSILSCIPKKGDTIIYDELAHACIKDESRLSLANRYSFKHNNLFDLEKKLEKSSGEVFVVAESIYSMDGDEAPLANLAKLSEQYNFHLILDEAHSTGLFENGKGLAHQLNISDKLFARIYTFGKAIGRHGACICGSLLLKDYLVNFARAFIYTTALPPSEIRSVQSVFKYLEQNGEKARNQLQFNIDLFKRLISNDNLSFARILNSSSPIQPIVIPNKKVLQKLSFQLNKKGFDVRPIYSPTVKEGEERLRIVIHSFNTREEITNLAEEILHFNP